MAYPYFFVGGKGGVGGDVRVPGHRAAVEREGGRG